MKDSTAGSSDAYPTFALLRRLLVDEALVHWPRYALASLMMAVAAAATALGAYFLGTLTNEAYVSHNFRGIVILGVAVMAIFAAKGLATYSAPSCCRRSATASSPTISGGCSTS